MKRLLHISPNQFPDLSIDHATKKIWYELAKDFEQYHILARSKDNRFHTYEEGNISLHLVPKFGKSKSFFLTSIYMLKIIRKNNINLMLSQCPLIGGFIATFISKTTKIPLMVEIHGMEYFRVLDSNKIHNKIISKMIRYSFRHANKVRSLSKKMTDMLLERNVNANIVEIPNRVNCNLFNLPKKDNSLNKKIKVVSVGRFVWEKGYEIAIKAILELQQKYDIELTLIGGGPLLEEYKEIAKDNKNFTFITWVQQEELLPILNQSDIYIQPSISEGMPRTILEAMAMKLPVIVSDVGAISGIVNHKVNGMLIEPGNIQSLENAIEELILNLQLRTSIANNGFFDATSTYEWNKVFSAYRKEVSDMINA